MIVRERAKNAGIAIVIAASVWQAASRITGTGQVPGVTTVLSGFWNSAFFDARIQALGGGDAGVLPHVLSTLINTLSGILAGGLAGVMTGFLFSAAAGRLSSFGILLESMRVIPPLLSIPVILIGVTRPELAAPAVVFLYSLASMAVYTAAAAKNVRPEWPALARFFGADQSKAVRHVVFPASLPEILEGAKATAALAVGLSVTTEYLAGPSGLGYVLKLAVSYSAVDLIFAGIIWSAIIAALLDAFLKVVALSRVAAWT